MKKFVSTKNFLCILICLGMMLCLYPTSVLAKDNRIKVEKQSDITEVLNVADAGDNITFVLSKANIRLGDKGEAKIKIPEGVTVTLTNAEGLDATVVRNPFYSLDNSAFIIEGSLVINENTAGGGLLSFNGGQSDFEKNSQFTVNGIGSALTINGGTFEKQNSYYGVVYSADGATTEINGGTFKSNKNATAQGGVIWAANSDLIINGGTFDKNIAGLTGGAIYYEGRTKENKLLVNGGTFSNNVANGAFGGGAIFIDCAKKDSKGTYYSVAQFNGGSFVNNSAPNGLGGAIYIQKDAEVSINQTYIHDNAASNDGGGVWNCATGGGDYYAFHGLYLAANSAKDEGDDFYSLVEENVKKPNIYLTDYAFTGDKFNWMFDTNDAKKGKTPKNDYYQNTSEIIALKSGLALNGSLDSNSMAVFSGNNAFSGGAIANNGYLQIGEEAKISVKKKTTVATKRAFDFRISLTRDGKGMQGSFVYLDSNTGKFGRVYFDAAGKGCISLKQGQKITILDLPAGANFKITETSLPNGWELKNSKNSSGEIYSNASSAPEINSIFVNTKEKQEKKKKPPVKPHDTKHDTSKTQTGDKVNTDLWIAFAVTSFMILCIMGLYIKQGRCDATDKKNRKE